MSHPVPGLTCVAALLLLAACGDEGPVAPGTPAVAGSPATALGFYGLSGAPVGPVGRACTAPEYRQFDFWVGQWELVDFNTGDPGGTNIITRELDGCAVLEDYAAGGYVGRSLNTYDAADRRWHQHWMANDGLPLLLDGGFTAGSMILQGERPSPAGPRIDRTAWTPLGSGEVRQLWEISSDGGVTFPTVQFDGRYLRHDAVVQDPEVPTAGCTNSAFPGYRLFDFTIGEWEVEVSGERRSVPGLRSSITGDLSACLIEERLTGPAGYEARVFSTMRRLTGEWTRTYMDSRGIRVLLRGVPAAGQLVLGGTMPIAGGRTVDVRATWAPVDADRWVQRYETSTDGGATWGLLVEAGYRRK